MDVFSVSKRSEVMSRIRSKDTKPELIVRHLLFSAGLRYRLYVRTLPGRPDIVLPKWRMAVFVNGCFWHSHVGCRFAAKPGGHADYWSAKLERNRERDRKSHAELLAQGWRVLVVWERACRKVDQPALQARMLAFIRGGERSLEIGRADLQAGALASEAARNSA